MSGKMIEELSLNHWQSLSTLLYDGWLLRFADGYTKRANSINPLYGSSLDLDEKVAYCEKLYAANQLRAAFKITPFAQPDALDASLEKKGYVLVDHTSVQTVSLDGISPPPTCAVHIDDTIQDEWIGNMCRLNQIAEGHRDAMRRMLANIRTKKAFVTLYRDQVAVACGLGVIERDYIGLYDIVTDARFRNEGYGTQLVHHLLHWGKENGAKFSYLAVLRDNAPAHRLYAKLGYEEVYTYWYRVKS
ncbi:GNAT family N-acetyltransferase [Brevibacillus sp. TJ4]|uniref:GNAT family N-acetyltransferase n=1 Tax=Brevibacillus sp. TJ4 TaxID=3234853 RepID=UPI003BA11D48